MCEYGNDNREGFIIMKKNEIKGVAITLGIMIVLSAVLLAVMAAVLWKCGAGEAAVGGCVTAVYIIVNFSGGFIIGKKAAKHKFLWGILVGSIYFAAVFLIGMWTMGSDSYDVKNIVGNALLCIVSAMFGGMLAG